MFAPWMILTLLSFDQIKAEPPVGSGEKPLMIHILAGQSNMEGHGRVGADPKRNQGKGSLAYLLGRPDFRQQWGDWLGQPGRWKTHNEIQVWYQTRKGPLGVGFGADADRIGPELGYGLALAQAGDQPVLLVKCAWGGKSLAIDFRPPSAGQPKFKLDPGTAKKLENDPKALGLHYRKMVEITRKALEQPLEDFPQWKDKKRVLAGLAWHQGWNDRIQDSFNKEYEENLAALIRDFRTEFQSPRLPVVIGETGMTGPEEKHPRALSLMRAQKAVAQREEFAGTVAFVETQKHWRKPEESPANQGFHWNQNGETYLLIGWDMGQAMNRLKNGPNPKP